MLSNGVEIPCLGFGTYMIPNDDEGAAAVRAALDLGFRHIDGAAGETLYLEHNGILRTTPLDSVKVAKDGSYSLKAVRPEYPDFYRLRIKNKTITFAMYPIYLNIGFGYLF